MTEKITVFKKQRNRNYKKKNPQENFRSGNYI